MKNLNQDPATQKRIRSQSVRERLSKMNNPEYFARTFLIAGLILIVGSSSFMNNPEIPRLLINIGIGLGIVMNIVAGMLYYSIARNRDKK